MQAFSNGAQMFVHSAADESVKPQAIRAMELQGRGTVPAAGLEA
jgi:hypothetical protein